MENPLQEKSHNFLGQQKKNSLCQKFLQRHLQYFFPPSPKLNYTQISKNFTFLLETNSFNFKTLENPPKQKIYHILIAKTTWTPSLDNLIIKALTICSPSCWITWSSRSLFACPPIFLPTKYHLMLYLDITNSWQYFPGCSLVNNWALSPK